MVHIQCLACLFLLSRECSTSPSVLHPGDATSTTPSGRPRRVHDCWPQCAHEVRRIHLQFLHERLEPVAQHLVHGLEGVELPTGKEILVKALGVSGNDGAEIPTNDPPTASR